MKLLREPLTGFLYLLISAALVFGAFSLSMAEGMVLAEFTPEATIAISPVASPVKSQTATPAKVMVTVTPPPPTPCPIPSGWIAYTTQPGDTLEKVAAATGITVDELKQANCLVSAELLPNLLLYLPPPPTPTVTASPRPGMTVTATPGCGAPEGWIIYTVKPGDTLFRISVAYYTTVKKLQYANCLGSSTLIRTGQKLYVPNVRTATPRVTATQTNPPATPTDTPVTVEPTTAVPPETDTPSPTP